MADRQPAIYGLHAPGAAHGIVNQLPQDANGRRGAGGGPPGLQQAQGLLVPAVQAAAAGQAPFAQALAQQGLAEAGFQAPIHHCIFPLFFADPTTDPNHNEAFNIVNSFDPSSAAPLTPAALKQAIIGNPEPNTFLCVAQPSMEMHHEFIWCIPCHATRRH